MLICEKCRTLMQEGPCPRCGNSLRLKEAEKDDICVLTRQPRIRADLLEDLLKQETIPCVIRADQGLGVLADMPGQTYRIEIRFSDYERAMEVLGEV